MAKLTVTGSFSLLAVACLTIMVGCVIVPGLPSIASALGVENGASWLVTLPSLGVILLAPLASKIIERVGLYKGLCVGLFLYGLLGCLGMFLKGPAAVFTDRLLLGGVTALVMAAGTGLISEYYEGRERLAMIARQGMSIELGGVLFLFLGGLLASQGWQWPFLLYLVAWLFLGMVILFVPVPHHSRSKSDHENSQGGISKALAFVFMAAALSMVVFFTGVIMLPIRLHDLGLSEEQVGYFLSFTSLVAVGAAALMPRAARKLGEHGTLAFAFMFYGLAHVAFATAEGLTLMIEGGICLGLGFGFSIPLVNHMTIEQSHVRQRARNLGYLSMAIFTGQFLSSFMELIPGGQSLMFACAGLIAFLAAAVTMQQRRHLAA